MARRRNRRGKRQRKAFKKRRFNKSNAGYVSKDKQHNTVLKIKSSGLEAPIPDRYMCKFHNIGFYGIVIASNAGLFTPAAGFLSFGFPGNGISSGMDLANLTYPTGGAVTAANLVAVSTLNDPPGFLTLCNSTTYTRYRVMASRIKVTVDVGAGLDEGTLMICPIPLIGAGTMYLTGNALYQGARTKKKAMFLQPSKESDASLSYYMTAAEMFGVNKNEIQNGVDWTMLYNTPYPSKFWGWQIGYVLNSAAAGGQTLSTPLGLKVEMTYYASLEQLDNDLVT